MRNPVKTPPIIVRARSKEETRPMKDFVNWVATHGAIKTAELESKRLTPYFEAMSNFLRPYAKTKKAQQMVTPQGLSAIFNTIARATRNTMTSGIIILPGSMSGYGQDYDQKYSYKDYSFRFGFLEILSKLGVGERSSTIVPIFRIDREILNRIEPYQPLPLLRDFQEVMSFVNHDVLHHLTSPVIHDSIVSKLSHISTKADFDIWLERIPNTYSAGTNLEDWSRVTHEQAWLSPGNTQEMERIRGHITHYFEELKRIGDLLYRSGSSHETVDFLGMLMGHALIRVFPLHHPMIAHWLKQMKQADTAPEWALADCCATLRGFSWKMDVPEYRSHIRASVSASFTNIIDSYRKHGLDIYPDDDSAVKYEHLKLIQLIKISADDNIAHTPSPADQTMNRLQKQAGKLAMNMVRIAARTQAG